MGEEELKGRSIAATKKMLQSAQFGLNQITMEVGKQSGELFPMTMSNNLRSYTFMVQNRKNACYLALTSRQKGSTKYTNTLTFIEKEELSSCRCGEYGK